MRRFLTGFAFVSIAVYAVALLAPRPLWFLPRGSRELLELALVLVLLPVTVAWIVVEVYHRLRPRRLFRGRRRASASIVAAGASTALVAFAAAGLGLVLADRWISDEIVVGAATAMMTLAAVAGLARARPGHCVYCNYDLRLTANADACCPECGAAAPTP